MSTRASHVFLSTAYALSFALVGCGGDGGGGGGGTVQGTVDQPYESCVDTTDVCTQGLSCLPTTLPASAGYTGELCTQGCNVDSDCPQDLSNFASICVNAQCYTQCPDGGANCPYGTACLTFDDTAGEVINLCTP